MLFPCGTFFPSMLAKVLLLDMLMSYVLDNQDSNDRSTLLDLAWEVNTAIELEEVQHEPVD